VVCVWHLGSLCRGIDTKTGAAKAWSSARLTCMRMDRQEWLGRYATTRCERQKLVLCAPQGGYHQSTSLMIPGRTLGPREVDGMEDEGWT